MEELLTCPHCQNQTLHMRQSFGFQCSTEVASLIMAGEKPECKDKHYKYVLETIEYFCSERRCSKATIRTYLCMLEGSAFNEILTGAKREIVGGFVGAIKEVSKIVFFQPGYSRYGLIEEDKADKIITSMDNWEEVEKVSEIKFLQSARHIWTNKIIGGIIGSGTEYNNFKLVKAWNICPSSSYKVFPDYIPSQIKKDYQEAHQTKEISPNASATLARRCLQGIIRDFYEIKKGSLGEEINALEEAKKVNEQTLKAIDKLRKFGNIGAHNDIMKEKANVMVNVDERTAGLLIWVIERFIEDTYIATHEEEEKLKEINDLISKPVP